MVIGELVGRLSSCALVTWRVPIESIAGLLHGPLRLTTIDGYAFWNIVLCRIERMRPRGLPSWLGVTYHHVAHRLFVHEGEGTAQREGLFFVRSDVDAPVIAGFGNRWTDLRMHAAAIELEADQEGLRTRVTDSADARGELVLDLVAAAAGSDEQALDGPCPPYVPRALSFDARRKRVRTLEVERDAGAWVERPLAVRAFESATLEAHGLRDIALARAVAVDPVQYRWLL